MPTLPTLTVTDAQASRITAAFGSVANYRLWLKQQIIAYVQDYEVGLEDRNYAQQRQDKRKNIEDDLGTAT